MEGQTPRSAQGSWDGWDRGAEGGEGRVGGGRTLRKVQGQVYVLTNISPPNKAEVIWAQSLTVEAFSSSCAGSELCDTWYSAGKTIFTS